MSKDNPSLRTPLGRVKGLGSAREGTHHWWAQRVTSVILIPASLWLIVSVILMMGQPYEAVREWFGNIFNCSMMVITLITLFYHVVLGVQVILEDYVHEKFALVATLWIVKGALIVLGALSLIATLKLGLTA